MTKDETPATPTRQQGKTASLAYQPSPQTNRLRIVFLGNGPLADAALETLSERFEIVFHARQKADLAEVARLKRQNPDLIAVLASFGVLIRSDLLNLFEPEGILNIHPSLLPKYRGPSPIESALLAGDSTFGVSVMKLATGMDSGPIYWQDVVLKAENDPNGLKIANLPLETTSSRTPPSPDLVSSLETAKAEIYRRLAVSGASWLCENLDHLPTPVSQNDQIATYTEKLTKNQGQINPKTETAAEIYRKILAFQGFPKTKYAFFGKNCIILAAHLANQATTAGKNQKPLSAALAQSNMEAPDSDTPTSPNSPRPSKFPELTLHCAYGQDLIIDRLQPEGRRPMDAKSFLNGYAKSSGN